jgi:signal transduction histidine kinase
VPGGAVPGGAAPAGAANAGAGPANGPAPAGAGSNGSRPNAQGAAAGQGPGPGRAAPAAQPTWRSLKNWRVRSRLLLLIIIPTLTAVILGGTYIVTAVQNALAYSRVETLANLSSDVTVLAAHLEDERDQTMLYIGQGTAGRPGTLSHNTADGAPQNLELVTQEQSLTTPWITKVRAESAAIGGGYPSQVQADAANITDVLKLLKPLRTAATTTRLPVVDVMTSYTSMIDQLLAIDDNIALGSGDPTLNNDVRALNLVSLIAEEASEQRGLLAYAFAQDGTFDPQVLTDVQNALEEQNANVAEFERVATPQQVALYNSSVSGSLVNFASSQELQAIQFGLDNRSLTLSATTANEWYGDMSTGTLGGIRTVEQDLVTATVSRATTLHRNAIVTASVIGAAVLIVLLLALLLTTVVGRSMVRPLRRLRSGALEVAGVRLPETVRRMSDSDGAAVPLEVDPIDVDSSDEIGEVARAFDQVHREALRLASNEAALRGNVNAMFVNLSRRSQSLVERQIRLIDDLEQGEQDPDRLSSLFQMDHLATRMRRNSENLLVLAGHDASRRWNQPVALVDVLRAAVSEIEQYERVTLNVQPGIAVRGHAVNDVVHLLAELAENATSFSSAETPVAVAGHLLSSGGVLLDITDQGVGMGAEEMAHANWRLDNPPVVDVAVSRRMGLFVVARLAARHGIRVRLRPAGAGGLTALVWLPDEVISHTGGGSAPSMRRFELPSAGGAPGSSLSAPSVTARSVTGTASAMPALPAGMNGDSEDMPSAAEQEINAARAPRFGSSLDEQGRETGLGPRRVPGAGLHPGNVPWGGAATTSPLPAVGTDAAEADLVGSGADGALSAAGSFQGEDGFAGVGDRTGRDFVPGPQSPSSGQPITLGQPTVVGRAPEADFARGSGSGNGHDDSRRSGAGTSGVVVPPAERMTTENRLPIFEAVESDWFRRGRNGVPAAAAPSTSASARQPERTAGAYADSGSSQPGGGYGGGTDGGWRSGQGDFEAPSAEPEVTWVASAADQGWEAAAAASSPATGGTTGAGLPKRVPQANLVPGTATPEPTTSAPARSASATRDRFASFQRGVREGRAAVAGDDGHSDEDDGSR